MNVNALLRDGREVKPKRFEDIEELCEVGVCSTEKFRYVHCVNEEDDDYLRVRDSRCEERVRVSEDKSDVQCPSCGRTIYLDQKTPIHRKRIQLDEDGLRRFVRKIATEATNSNFTKVSGGVDYLDYTLPQVNQANVSGTSVLTPVITERIPEEALQTARIKGDNLVWVLAGGGLGQKNTLSQLNFDYLTIGDLIGVGRETAKERLSSRLERTAESRPTEHLEVAIQCATQLCSSRDVLEAMGWAEFEHCVHTLLQGALGTSYLLGETQRGSGEPDGALTLHWREESLFMWDAKFVDLEKNEQTKLSGEYDKIFRHLKRMDTQERYQREFDGVSGILLFTPGIKQANVRRLAETIHEREISSPKTWNGSIVYFELDALIELARAVRENRGDVRYKPNLFRKALHANLTSPSKHGDDPEKVYSPDYKSIHMSVGDIEDMFEFIASQSSEHTEFNREEYLREGGYFNDI